jgi:Fic family protein
VIYTQFSKDTAIRDINDLRDKNILQKEAAGGRTTNFELKKLINGSKHYIN